MHSENNTNVDSPERSGMKLIPSETYDCVDKDYNSFLRIFGVGGNPSKIKCFNRFCSRKYIFSEFKSNCKVCGETVEVGDMITHRSIAGSERFEWIHVHCFDHQEICVRCQRSITNGEGSLQFDGWYHHSAQLSCIPKKRRVV
jgi:hypothetical protein